MTSIPGYCIPFSIYLPPKQPKGCMNRQYQAKRTKNSNFCIIIMTSAIATKFCTMIKKMKFSWVVPKFEPQIQKADGRHINKRLCYSRGTARHACQQKFCNYKTSNLKTRVLGLSRGIICVILHFFIQYRSVSDRHTHTQTKRRMDRHTTTA